MARSPISCAAACTFEKRATEQHDVVAIGGEATRERTAKADAGAGNDDHFGHELPPDQALPG